MTEYFARVRDEQRSGRQRAPKANGKLARGALHTLPILLAGSMAMSLNLVSPLQPAQAAGNDKAKDSGAQLRKAVLAAMNASAHERDALSSPTEDSGNQISVASTVPATYRVAGGDTVSGIAARHGLATATVLALNGLGWKSLIFPGQVLRLVKAGTVTPPPVSPPVSTPPSAPTTTYTIKSGDTIGGIAARFGVSTQSVLTANGLGWSSIIYPGRTVAIPGATVPGTTPVVDLEPVSEVTPIDSAPQVTSYLIKSGDTITSIAARFGVSVKSILSANGLNMTSIIYTGRTLAIPAGGSTPASVGGVTTALTSEMATNARTIIAVGKSLGVSDYGLVISLATAMQESSLRNLNYGDRDSLGLFQQRPSTGWGTPAQVTDPAYASLLFFGGPSNPNKGITRGLLDIPGWQSMSVTKAAQAVQISAFPNAYAKWEASARVWLAQLTSP